ncbi:hypothetical protein AK812_SmicGene24559 [Symbiodinium microadriaticum]|uniref:Uncharacterized protein n=1 Tax=Symbiodinium microadriaticum TaxID=2951 RepID=A0A1Q9DEP4_SYMMI|nr:hypothetical protein AK812_SmicGene24559 [Symbiodinium microadriaticum]
MTDVPFAAAVGYLFYERYADGHQEGIQYVGAGRGEMETKLIEVGAGQGSYTKQKDVTYGYRPKPHPTLEARPRFEWLVRWGGGAGPRHFAAAGSCAGASKRGLLALLPLWWVCEVRSFFTGETCGRGPEPSRDACLAAPHSPTLMNTVRGVPTVRGQADFCCSQCGVNCYDPITTTEAPRVVVRRHYNTVVRCASFQFSPTPIGLLIYVAVQKPNAHYECFNGGDYDHEMWSAAHKRWCCYKYKEGCPKQVVDRNIYHHVTKIQKLHVPVPVQIIHNIPQVYHVPSPPKYVHVPVPGPKIHKVTINKDVPYPVKEPPQVITVKKPYTVKVPGHYVDVPVPSPPHIVNKYKYHYVTVHDYDARHKRLLKGSWHHHHVVTITGVQHLKHYDCHAGLSNWYHGWSHVKKSWCCVAPTTISWAALAWRMASGTLTLSVVHTIMGHHAGHGGYDCDAGYSNWEHGWSYHKKTYCCEHEHKGCQPYHCHHHEAPCTLHGDTSTCKQRIGWSMEHTFDGKENACGLAYSAVQVECDVCRACTIQEAGCGDQGNAALGNWPWPRCRAWSPEKKVWCCQNEQKGCQNPDTPPDCDAGAGMVWKHLGSRASSHGKVFVSNHWTWQASHGVRFVVGNARAAFGRPLAQLGHGMVGAEEDVVPALPPSVDGHGCCSHEKVGCPGYHYAGAGGGGQTVVTTHTVVSGGGGGSFGGAYSFHGHPPSAAGSGMMWHWVVHTHGNLPFDCFAGITAGWSGGKKHFCCLHFDKGYSELMLVLTCFEADTEAGRTEERWASRHEIQESVPTPCHVLLCQLEFCPCGGVDSQKLPASRGDFEKEKVTVSSGPLVHQSSKERFKEERPDGTVKSATAEVSGLPFNFFQTGADEMVPAPDPCMTGTVGAMTVMQREACCAQGNVAFCATTTKAPVIIHDKYYTNVRTSPIVGETGRLEATRWFHEEGIRVQRVCCYEEEGKPSRGQDWVKDLTEDGDVEPNPGPSSPSDQAAARGDQLSGNTDPGLGSGLDGDLIALNYGNLRTAASSDLPCLAFGDFNETPDETHLVDLDLVISAPRDEHGIPSPPDGDVLKDEIAQYFEQLEVTNASKYALDTLRGSGKYLCFTFAIADTVQGITHRSQTSTEALYLLKSFWRRVWDGAAPAGLTENYEHDWQALHACVQKAKHSSAGCSTGKLKEFFRRPATTEISAKLGPRAVQTIFIDDRTLVLRDATQTRRAIDLRATAAARLGLRENERKRRLVTRSEAHRRALQSLGMQPDPDAVVLGTTFSIVPQAFDDTILQSRAGDDILTQQQGWRFPEIRNKVFDDLPDLSVNHSSGVGSGHTELSYFEMTQHVSHVVPVPVPGPPAKVVTQKVYVKHHPFECTEGYGSWKTQWSHEHQRYCCYKFKEACVTKVQYRNHYKTITHVHHVTVPEKVVVPAPPPREINHIVKDPSPVIKIKTAGPPRVVKHYVTKKHYVPEPVPSPPTYRYKHVAVPVHVPGKVVHVPVPMPAKTIYKEVPVTKVQHVIQKRYYDCVAGFKNWHFGWSKTKKSWCCSHEQRGCPGTWQGDGLTKTIVTGVTQHIGHGHVHVIHHVHHYTTSSHDVDDLVGDDDASLPPEYRHGDMIVGGDDESLPPEYRHGDMSIGGDDDTLWGWPLVLSQMPGRRNGAVERRERQRLRALFLQEVPAETEVGQLGSYEDKTHWRAKKCRWDRLTGGQFYNTDVTIDGIGEGGGSCGRDASRELIRATAQDTALAVGSLAAFHSSVDGSRFQVPRDDAADDDDDDALLCRWRAGGWKA